VVEDVDDGDTLHVRVPGQGRLYIRMTGINAAELTSYHDYPYTSGWEGKCHGVEAARRLQGLVLGKTVRVHARDLSSASGARVRRSIAVEINGVWTDVGGILIDEGLALFLPSTTEYQVNADYLRRAQVAAANRVGFWNTASCGAGPSDEAKLSMVVQWDAPGDDNQNINGEHFKIINRGDAPVSLGGWWVRDSAERGTKDHPGYRIPAGTTVAPHASVTIRVGSGSDTTTTKYWGLRAPVFENVTTSPSYLADGGYLFDPQGDLRAWQLYPCNQFCPVPALRGKVAITKIMFDPAGVDVAKNEYVVVKNVSSAKIDLTGYQLRGDSKRWTFRSGSTLAPREQVYVYLGRGKNTRLKQYMGFTGSWLTNTGGTSMIFDPLGTRFLCRAWGRGRC
jgi:endonuclease YncB( thermonuclease family)